MSGIAVYCEELRDLLARLPIAAVDNVRQALIDAYLGGRRVFFLGNGGSASTASHFACDLAKNTISPGAPRFKAIALTDNIPLLTAWSNDTSYANVFAAQLENLIESGDLVIAISGSGNSPNVLTAIELAHEFGARTVGLTGFQGGKLKNLVDICVIVPSDSMEQIEDVHLALEHALCRDMRQFVHEHIATGHLALAAIT